MQLEHNVSSPALRFLVFTFAFSCAYGQMIQKPEIAFQNEPFFNPTFIKNHNIQRLQGKILTKRKNDVFRETKGFVAFSFHSTGCLSSVVTYKPYASYKDSVVHLFSYDSLGNVAQYRILSPTGCSERNYLYRGGSVYMVSDSLQLKGKNKADVGSRCYDRTEQGNQSNCIVKNECQIPIRSWMEIIGDENKVMERIELDLINRDTLVTQYRYDVSHNLVEKSMRNQDGSQMVCFTYAYDTKNFLQEIKEQKNGKIQKEIQILYTSEGSISDLIFYNHEMDFMEIVRF